MLVHQKVCKPISFGPALLDFFLSEFQRLYMTRTNSRQWMIRSRFQPLKAHVEKQSSDALFSYIYRRIKRGILKGTNPLCISKGTRKSHPIFRGTEVWRYPNWLSITSLIWLGILHGFIYCSKHVESISVKICGSKGPKEIKTKYRILIVHDVHRQQAESDWTVISLENLRSDTQRFHHLLGVQFAPHCWCPTTFSQYWAALDAWRWFSLDLKSCGWTFHHPIPKKWGKPNLNHQIKSSNHPKWLAVNGLNMDESHIIPWLFGILTVSQLSSVGKVVPSLP